MTRHSLLAATLLILGTVAAAQSSFEDLAAAAQQYQRSGDYAAAAAEYRAALKLRPGIAELWANLGFMENQMNHYDDAIQHFDQALRLKPQMFAPNLFIGLDELERSHPAAAVRYLTRAEAIDRSDPQAPLALGRAYAAEDRLPEAAGAYARAAALEPEKNRALFAEGIALLKDVENAARTLSSTASDSKYAQALLAKSFLQEGKPNQVAAILESLEQRDPPFLKITLPLLIQGAAPEQVAALETSSPMIAPFLAPSSSAAAPCGASTDHAAASLVQIACRLQAGNPWPIYDSAIRQPISPASLFWRILSAQRLAEDTLARAAAIAPDAPQTHVLLGDIARQQQQVDAALTEYNKALAIAPGDPAALLGATAAYLLDAKPEQAIMTAQLFLANRPDDPEMNLLLAEALVSRRDYAGADAPLRKATGVRPELQPRRHALLGKVYVETGQPAAAIRELKLGLSTDDDGSVHYQLARLYRRTGDTAAAKAAMAESKRLADQRLRRASIAIGASLPAVSAATH